MSWVDWAKQQNAALDEENLKRTIRDFDAKEHRGVIHGSHVVSFASNDYLGLSHHPRVIAAAHEATERWGAGAGSARLIAGARPIHSQLEEALARWKGAEKALLFPTGFAANLGVLTSLAGGADIILSDRLNHASIVDGCRASRSPVKVYDHCHVGQVAEMLRGESRAIVVTEHVFSMDGDVAPLRSIAEACIEHGALLVIDEAHDVLEEEVSLPGTEVVRVGTLSKTLGSMGGFAAGPAPLIDLLTSVARPFIFTTAAPPSTAAAALAALEILRSAEGDDLRRKLRANIDRFQPGHRSPIVPLVFGDEEAAIAASDALLERGIFIPAIRPPTVPAGTSRLRISFSTDHTDEQIDHLKQALAGLTTPSTRFPGNNDRQVDAITRKTGGPGERSGRRGTVVVVVGSRTEVGKTWVTAGLARSLAQRGVRVAARKPVQSFGPGDDITDAQVLSAATGEERDQVCPEHRSYPLPLAPPLAASRLGLPAIALSDLVAETADLEADVVLIETVGGPRSPVADDADSAALATAFDADLVLLVADAGLGAINDVTLGAGCVAGRRLLVYLNRFQPGVQVHRLNREWIEQKLGFAVATDVEEATSMLLEQMGPQEVNGPNSSSHAAQ